jgi:hypothetical protein
MNIDAFQTIITTYSKEYLLELSKQELIEIILNNQNNKQNHDTTNKFILG